MPKAGVEPARRSLLLRAGTLAEVEEAQVVKHPDATVDVAPDARLLPRGAFEVTADGVRFTLDVHQANVRHLTASPLLGLRRLSEVTAHNPEYLAGATAYVPSAPAAMAALRGEPRPVVVRIYYGSWCSHCRQLVPHAVKLEQQLGGSRIRFEYFGLRDPLTDPEAKKGGVVLIPTAVVLVAGREAGRMVSDRDWEALEVALRGRARRAGRAHVCRGAAGDDALLPAPQRLPAQGARHVSSAAAAGACR